MTEREDLAPISRIEGMIHLIRGQRVMLDSDLAKVYGVDTKVLNQAVKRNLDRFPEDFMFKLTSQEVTNLKSQIVTSRSHGGKRKLPFVFTEHGAIMAVNVLNSKQAVTASVQVVRAFVKLRDLLVGNCELARKLCIKYDIAIGGYRDPEEKWPEIHDALIEAMIRLEKAIKPYISKLKV